MNLLSTIREVVAGIGLDDITISSMSFTENIVLLTMLLVVLTQFFIYRHISRINKQMIVDVQDITSYNRLIEDEIGIIKTRSNELFEKQTNFVDTTTTSNDVLFDKAPYTQAIELAKRGYSRSEIISLCSLTDSEAELILALHSGDQAA